MLLQVGDKLIINHTKSVYPLVATVHKVTKHIAYVDKLKLKRQVTFYGSDRTARIYTTDKNLDYTVHFYTDTEYYSNFDWLWQVMYVWMMDMPCRKPQESNIQLMKDLVERLGLSNITVRFLSGLGIKNYAELEKYHERGGE